MAWPKKINTATERSFSLDIIYDSRQQFLDNPLKFAQFNDGERWTCGYVLPPFQRDRVWEQDRAVGFVENVILGHHPGHWQFNNATDFEMAPAEDGRMVWKYDRWLLDGQQRLAALDAYWADEFPVFGGYWSEATVPEQRRFLHTMFTASEHHLNDYDALYDLYFRINRAGVPHTDDEMALGRR